MKYEPVPDYLAAIEDSALLGVKPWEIGTVPMHWRAKARIVNVAKKEALQAIAKKSKAMLVHVLDI